VITNPVDVLADGVALVMMMATAADQSVDQVMMMTMTARAHPVRAHPVSREFIMAFEHRHHHTLNWRS